MRRLCVIFGLVAGCLLAPAGAAGEEKLFSETPLYPGGEIQDAKAKKDWKIRLGGFSFYHPRYEGAEDYKISAFPFFDIKWRNVFLNARKGLGVFLPGDSPVTIGLALSYTLGRDEDDSDDLEGLGDVDGGLTANGLIEWKIIKGTSLGIHYERQVTGEETGYQVHGELGFRAFLPPRFILKPSLRATFASNEYMDAFFGVTSKQSARSGLREYRPEAGLKSVGMQIMLIYPFMEKWGLQVLGGYDRLVGDAADSPVVRDADQFSAGLGLSYSF